LIISFEVKEDIPDAISTIVVEAVETGEPSEISKDFLVIGD
jgi:hypothetical protein